MGDEDVRDKLRKDIAAVAADALLPHHRRGALLILATGVDILDAAEAIATDDATTVAAMISDGTLSKPSLGQLADWCVDVEQRFQFVIVQPYVVAQLLPRTELN